MYSVNLTDRELDSARWLNDRGYLGGILDIGHVVLVEEKYEGTAWRVELAEPEAWAVLETIDAAPGASRRLRDVRGGHDPGTRLHVRRERRAELRGLPRGERDGTVRSRLRDRRRSRRHGRVLRPLR